MALGENGTGADFHRAMVATAPGEKKTPHRAPPYEELDLATIFYLFHCELRLIIDVIDVMICSLQSANVLYLLYITYLLNFEIPNPFCRSCMVCLALTIPVTTSTAERSFSTLRTENVLTIHHVAVQT